jgi:hypothetical protein
VGFDASAVRQHLRAIIRGRAFARRESMTAIGAFCANRDTDFRAGRAPQ